MSQAKILIVEDETITALDIQRSLTRSGYKVTGVACTGPKAIELAQQVPADLVLMDIRLKGDMDGIEAALAIRKKTNTPVVFLTAYADRPTLERAKNAEPYAYLLKPFEEAVLCTTIEIALHKHRAHDLMVQQTSEAIQIADSRFNQLTENIPDYAVTLLDSAGLILSWSPGAERLHGWSAAEALGKPSTILYPQEDIAQHKPEHDLEVAVRLPRYAEYCSQIRKDETHFSAQTVLIGLRDKLGKIAGFLRVTREVSPNSGN